MNSKELGRNLIAMGTRLLERPKFDLQKEEVELSFYESVWNADSKSKFLAVVRALGTFSKRVESDYLHCSIKEGVLTLDIYANRAATCEKVMVLKEVEEWDCQPILSELEKEPTE